MNARVANPPWTAHHGLCALHQQLLASEESCDRRWNYRRGQGAQIWTWCMFTLNRRLSTFATVSSALWCQTRWFGEGLLLSFISHRGCNDTEHASPTTQTDGQTDRQTSTTQPAPRYDTFITSPHWNGTVIAPLYCIHIQPPCTFVNCRKQRRRRSQRCLCIVQRHSTRHTQRRRQQQYNSRHRAVNALKPY